MTKDILLKFAKAWDDQDIDMIASFLTRDCIYKGSVGPEPGITFEGKASVMQGIKNMLEHDSGGKALLKI